MRLSLCSLAVLALTTASCGAPPERGAGGAPRPSACVSIAAWNDLHGQLEPELTLIDATQVPAGGLVALADVLAAVRASGDPVITLDAGDLFTGTLESTLAEGAPIIDAYNAMGVDAVAIGNHEFDFGPVGYDQVLAAPNADDDAGARGPRGALLARQASARFPFLSANVRRRDGKPLAWPRLRRSTHVLRGGFDVGVVGYTTTETPRTTLLPNLVGLDFATDAAANVAAEVRALRKAGAAPIVLLAHASLDGTLPQQLDDPADPEGARRVGELATLLDAIPPADRPDLIVGGHRHQWMMGLVRGVPVVSADRHGIGLTRIRYCRDVASLAPRLDRIDRHVAMASSAPVSALGRAVLAAIAPWQARMKTEADAIVTTLRTACRDRALDGTALVEQTARAIAEHASEAAAAPPGVPIVGFANAGGVRDPLPVGVVRYRNLFATSPFENGVSVCATTRGALARIITNSISVPNARDRLPFGIAGAHVKLTRAADGGLALKSLELDGGRSPRDDDPIWLAVPDFVLWGGDGLLDGVACSRTAIAQIRVREAWRQTLAREHACDGAPKNVTIGAP